MILIEKDGITAKLHKDECRSLFGILEKIIKYAECEQNEIDSHTYISAKKLYGKIDAFLKLIDKSRMARGNLGG